MEDGDKIDWESNKVIELFSVYGEEIKFFFQRDTWHKDEASFILVGILPIEFIPFGYPKLNGGIIRASEKDALIDRGSMYLKLWESNPNNPDKAPPEEFIKWALSKEIKIPWLDNAIENGLLSSDVVIPSTGLVQEVPGNPLEALENWFATASLKDCIKCGFQIPLVVYAAYLTWHVNQNESCNKWLNIFLSNLNLLIAAVSHGDLRGCHPESRLPIELTRKYKTEDAAIDANFLIDLNDFCEWAERSGLPIPDMALGVELEEHFACFLKVNVPNCEAFCSGLESIGEESYADRASRLFKRVAEEKAKGTKAFLKIVAAEASISVSRLKQILQKESEKSAPNSWLDLATPSRQTPSRKPKSKC